MRLLSILSISLCSWTCYTFSLITSSPQSTVGSFDCVFEGTNELSTSIHLVSLPKFSSPDLPSSNIIVDSLVGWKRAALGDGGIYWDQRPKSLLALNSAVAEHVFHRLSSYNQLSSSMTNVECAVISTCARFEILLCIQTPLIYLSSDNRTHATIQQHRQGAIVSAVAECLAIQMIDLNRFRQIKSWRRRDDIRRISTDTYSRWINITNAEHVHHNRGDEAPYTDSDRISWIRQLRNVITWEYIQKGKDCKHWKRFILISVSNLSLSSDGIKIPAKTPQ
jgi:hypothetical protein